MTEILNTKRLGELCESEFKELESVYQKLRDLKVVIAQMHDEYASQAIPPAFEKVEAVYLLAEDVFTDLERYLLPEYDPDSSYEPVRREE